MIRSLVQKLHATVEASVCIDTPSTVHVTVYGLLEHGNTIGEVLSDNQYFLQPPADYIGVPYINPQILVAPTTDLEQWHASLEDGTKGTGFQQARALNRNSTSKTQVDEVLDSASGPSTFNKVNLDERLKTELKP